jgi:hypothetical protein
MNSIGTDIIIPIWNRTTEARECLSALVEHARDARLILLDRGSDPGTEQMLHEFAELLDDRAILISLGRALGFIETVNRGLAVADAPLRIVLRPTSIVTRGWLEPLAEAALNPEAGILVPMLHLRDGARQSRSGRRGGPAEVSPASLAALGFTERLYRCCGGLDEGLDGGDWCLRDYARKAEQAGLRSLLVEESAVFYREETLYGALSRREAKRVKSAAIFRERWGDSGTYALFLTARCGSEMLEQLYGPLLTGARRGDRFFIFASPAVIRNIRASALDRLHGNITLTGIGRFFAGRSRRIHLERLRQTRPDVKVLSGREGLLGFGGEGEMPFAEMENRYAPAEV